MLDNDILLKVSKISKQFPGVKALDKVDLTIKKGEVHALCGENGAGKSTLMNILSGIYKPDEGMIAINGETVQLNSQQKAQEHGISTVYQERSLVDNLNVAENIFAGRQPIGKGGLIDWKALYRRTKELLMMLELDYLNSKTLVGNLAPAQQQMVEIAKALSIDAKILILDEPTATITETETKALFKIINRLKEQGSSVIYISHRIAEIFEIADNVSVFKDGKYMGTRKVNEINHDDIVKMMVGRDLVIEEYTPNKSDKIVLEVKNLTSKRFTNISFKLHRGEILSFAGLAGAGRTELARAIIGADKKTSGEVFVDGKKRIINTPADAILNGLGYMPENRKEDGLFLDMSVADNIYSAKINFLGNTQFVKKSEIKKVAESYKNKLSIVTPDVNRKVVNLSGGNQQKVVLSKWLLLSPRILIVDEPTRGVDVGAKAEIYKILRDLAKQGTSIIVISSDLPEVLAISDRILVMWNGQITGEIGIGEASEEEIMHMASGLAKKETV